ncbi:hypothetical protein PHAVU_002G191900 [Phaseolus vulgaris]|uniref:Uncharacterized protein n=1 Tax=Phaseolus vulgaris TaxID=3885 RepID=V7CL89_PHAVU|nr:hypothetical protein PHAVU_002G191900g [Phaseolus vulgaris]ESW30904.1 hypothetical protein PHAVU_002G191900g [Phaseolus vulgaris]
MTLPCGSVMTRSVPSYNLESEFELIYFIIVLYPFISMDTEFPDVVFHLTISDDHENLPTFGTSNLFIWEFYFCEFDVTRHPHVSHSIALLRQGMNFDKNRKFGVSIVRFAELMMFSGLLCNNNIQWIAFHNAYHFEYIVKILEFESLGLDNSSRKSHHIGSDSLVILHVFNKIETFCFHTSLA